MSVLVSSVPCFEAVVSGVAVCGCTGTVVCSVGLDEGALATRMLTAFRFNERKSMLGEPDVGCRLGVLSFVGVCRSSGLLWGTALLDDVVLFWGAVVALP